MAVQLRSIRMLLMTDRLFRMVTSMMDQRIGTCRVDKDIIETLRCFQKQRQPGTEKTAMKEAQRLSFKAIARWP